MVGVVLVTHGGLGAEMLATAEHIAGSIDQARAVGIDASDSMEQFRHKVAAAISAVDSGEGVLLLADMFGGSASNLSLSFLDKERVEVVCGLNLPMVLKLATAREGTSLQELARFLTSYGQRNIVFASSLLGGARGEAAAGHPEGRR